MREAYLPGKHGLRDLRKALALHEKVGLTPIEQTEFQNLLDRLDRLRAVEFLDAIATGLNGGLELRPRPERAPIQGDETWQAERARIEREQQTF